MTNTSQLDPFRKSYTPSDDRQKKLIKNIQDCCDEFYELLNEVNKYDARCAHIAKIKLEESFMWSVKGVTNARLKES